MRRLFDIRPGERLRTALMTLYLTLVLFAYYILKPVSRALFLTEFNVDKLPQLVMLVAALGGVLAYVYTVVAVRSSLQRAVVWASGLSILSLLGIWHMLGRDLPWMLYVFNVWVSLFSIVMVSQGWLIAAQLFNSREAKRVYSVVGVGGVLGAAFGGSLTAVLAPLIGSRNLLLVSAAFVLASYLVFVALRRHRPEALAHAAAAEQPADFGLRDILGGIANHRHLQVIVAVITITYVVDVIIEYQFSYQARSARSGDDLTAFLGGFFGIWLNLVTFFLQLFLTAAVVRRFGVGGTLQIMPIAIAAVSMAGLLSPGMVAAMCARLAEAATRYSFNRTGMELLYLPLPSELKNRTKAFVDIFADRFARGLAGALLIVLMNWLRLEVWHLSYVTLGLAGLWIWLSYRAREEYIATVRKRLQLGQLDWDGTRVENTDPATIRLLEAAALGSVPRQAIHALTLLAGNDSYRLEPLLLRAVRAESGRIRAHAFQLAAERRLPALQEVASAELRQARAGEDRPSARAASGYLVALDAQPGAMARRLLDHPSHSVVEGALEAVCAASRDTAQEVVDRDWLARAAASPEPGRRILAASAVRVRGDEGTEVLHQLLADPAPAVVAAACRAAGALGHHTYLSQLTPLLAHPQLRGPASRAIAAYGPRVIGHLEELLNDESVPLHIRCHLPRVLRRIPDQRSADALLRALQWPDRRIHDAAVEALDRLRRDAPQLVYGEGPVTEHILREARRWYELSAALEPLKAVGRSGPAVRLLTRTLEHRLQDSLARVFRLIGLRYPPKDVEAIYRAVRRRRAEESAAALEFLETMLDRQLRETLLPLLDEDYNTVSRYAESLGIRKLDAPEALTVLIRDGDQWLAACSAAAAGELRMETLLPVLRALAGKDGEVARVAASALAAIA